MKDEDPRFFPSEFESRQVCRDQIDQKRPAHQITAGKPRNFQGSSRRCKIEKEALEISVFRLVYANIYLIQGTEEDQNHRTREAEHGQLERGERFHPVNNVIGHWVILACLEPRSFANSMTVDEWIPLLVNSEMVFAESVVQRPISIDLIDSELAEALPGRRTVSVCTVLKRCKSNASPISAKADAYGQRPGRGADRSAVVPHLRNRDGSSTLPHH